MATIAEFTVPSGAFPLGTLFRDVPDATMELDRIVPTRNSLLPYVWVRNGDAGDIESAVRDHPDLDDMVAVDEADGVVLYRVEWAEERAGILSCIVETDVSLLSGTGTSGEWTFEVRSDGRDGISAFEECCAGHGVSLTLGRLHTLSDGAGGGRYDLTPEQREALLLAYEGGYYEEPSETDLEALASQLGITRPSLSARLKRGYRNLIASALVDGDRSDT